MYNQFVTIRLFLRNLEMFNFNLTIMKIHIIYVFKNLTLQKKFTFDTSLPEIITSF